MDDADRAQVQMEREEARREAQRFRQQALAPTGTEACCDCGEIIPRARRLAVPNTTRCTDCAREHEREIRR